MPAPGSIRIGFITSTDPMSRRSWSGVHYSIFKALERNIGEVVALGPVQMRWTFALGDRVNNWVMKPLTGKRYQYGWSVLVARWYAWVFGRKLAGQHFDLLVAPASFTEIAYLRTDIPIVYIEDSTLHQLIDFYPGLSGLLTVSKAELNHLEKLALTRARLVCYSSEWAAHSARYDYGTPAEKIVVLPFGSNYPTPPTREVALRHVPDPDKGCRLFLLGGEWERKGAAIAYDTMLALNELGLQASLTVVGCVPPAAEAHRYQHPGFRAIPYLDMGNDESLAQLQELFQMADFFILPSRAECAAIAFADANSFGLPVVTTDVGGIRSFVLPDITGLVLPLSADGADFAAAISQLYRNPAAYAQMRAAARQRYDGVLNWDHWARQLQRELATRGVLEISQLSPGLASGSVA
ncbi:glycosyltransferase family 4 protein [Hymenobacter sp. BT664]|uniref:Glycosyltransferase family 4 protein n=1 Tax=Hymenobacter montanus TaxID=2771359 RepID=A0A927BA53_9BACT|nr:glycosyltransferase family 4 protein [Hymenobacter montanus]MBD2766424.1 glycosyltransferase family 4 protein [Hymenobacter montanus]